MKAGDGRRTPPAVFEALTREFGFALDVAADAENRLTAGFLQGPCVGPLMDCHCGLCGRWTRQGANWCNPPYSKIEPWVRKAAGQAREGATSVLLVPVDFSAAWFRTAWRTATEWRPVEQRIKFLLPDGSQDSSAKQPSGLFIWRGYAAPGPQPRITFWSWR